MLDDVDIVEDKPYLFYVVELGIDHKGFVIVLHCLIILLLVLADDSQLVVSVTHGFSFEVELLFQLKGF